MKYISISQRIKNITEPLNKNILNYYNILFDGASRKNFLLWNYVLKVNQFFMLCLLKSLRSVTLKGLRNQWTMLCQKWNSTLNGLKRWQEYVVKAQWSIVQCIIFCMMSLVSSIYAFYVSNKFELSINDAFGSSVLSNNTEKDYTDIYYFLKVTTAFQFSEAWHFESFAVNDEDITRYAAAFSYLYYNLRSHHAECKMHEKFSRRKKKKKLFITVSYSIILT